MVNLILLFSFAPLNIDYLGLQRHQDKQLPKKKKKKQKTKKTTLSISSKNLGK